MMLIHIKYSSMKTTIENGKNYLTFSVTLMTVKSKIKTVKVLTLNLLQKK